jgi:hypothetical protein
MLQVNYNYVTDQIVTPFPFVQWYSQNDGRYLLKAKYIEQGKVTIEELLFIKTVNILTVYRRYDEKIAIFQCELQANSITIIDTKFYRYDDSETRFMINLWINKPTE